MAGKGTRHRFELSRLEIAGVVISATAGLFVVFMLGIYAGRGMADRRVESGEQIVRLPVAPAVEQTPAADEGLTFYDTLGKDDHPMGEARDGEDRRLAAVPSDERAAVPAPAKTVDPKLAEAKAVEAKASEPKAIEEAPLPPTHAAPAAPPKEPVHVAAAQPTPAAKPERPAASTPARVAVALADAPPPLPKTEAHGEWSVQVSASRDPRTADGVLQHLRSKGYEAFVLKVRRGSETFYRVRVGHYGTLEEAQQVVSRLRHEPGVPEAFVASD